MRLTRKQSMRSIRLSFLLAFAVLANPSLWAQAADSQRASTNENQPLYLNSDASLDQRVNDLVSRMTLDEKISQMQNNAPAIPRLGIPAYGWANEALHGVALAGQATVFPQAIGMAATWDTDLVHSIADVISTEARAKHNDAVQHGLAGNEDCGQMSAWYVISALGFYPVDPVSGNYVFGTPLFNRAEVELSESKRLVIKVKRTSPEDKYISSISLNGSTYNKVWFSHADIANGGEIVFNMSSQPDKAFGVDQSSLPPSLDI